LPNVFAEFAALGQDDGMLEGVDGMTAQRPGRKLVSMDSASAADSDAVGSSARPNDLVPVTSVAALLDRYAWAGVDVLHASLDGREHILFGSGDEGRRDWLRHVRIVALRLGSPQIVDAVSEALRGTFKLCGDASQHYFWCRTRRSGQAKTSESAAALGPSAAQPKPKKTGSTTVDDDDDVGSERR